MAHLLEINNLDVKFDTDEGRITAIENVSLSLDQGKVLGIVGESGSGKSVTAKSIMQLNPGNTIYNAFVRVFGEAKFKGTDHSTDKNHLEILDEKGYTVVPPSGKFRDLIDQLDFIIGNLRCRIIQLLPIHPTPSTYARMGRFGIFLHDVNGFQQRHAKSLK